MVNGQFSQSEPNQLSEKEIKKYKKKGRIIKCEKCQGEALSSAGSIYCNDCGLVENTFYKIMNLKS